MAEYRKIDYGKVIGISIDTGHYIIQSFEGHFYTLLEDRMEGEATVGDKVFIYYKTTNKDGWKIFTKNEIYQENVQTSI